MRIKKINAFVSLLTVLLLLLHVGYSGFCYLTMYYNPVLKIVFTMPFMLAVLTHAVLGMLSVFLLNDGTALLEYPGLNWKTMMQRISAALIFPLLFLHIKSFDLYSFSAERGNYILFFLVLFGNILFYLVLVMHVSVSISKALITLGLLSSKPAQERIDRIAIILGIIIMVCVTVVIVRGLVIMFLK